MIIETRYSTKRPPESIPESSPVTAATKPLGPGQFHAMSIGNACRWRRQNMVYFENSIRHFPIAHIAEQTDKLFMAWTANVHPPPVR
jgi:hypothetical protein